MNFTVQTTTRLNSRKGDNGKHQTSKCGFKKGLNKQSMTFPRNTNTDYDATMSVLTEGRMGEKKELPTPTK